MQGGTRGSNVQAHSVSGQYTSNSCRCSARSASGLGPARGQVGASGQRDAQVSQNTGTGTHTASEGGSGQVGRAGALQPEQVHTQSTEYGMILLTE